MTKDRCLRKQNRKCRKQFFFCWFNFDFDLSQEKQQETFFCVLNFVKFFIKFSKIVFRRVEYSWNSKMNELKFWKKLNFFIGRFFFLFLKEKTDIAKIFGHTFGNTFLGTQVVLWRLTCFFSTLKFWGKFDFKIIFFDKMGQRNETSGKWIFL